MGSMRKTVAGFVLGGLLTSAMAADHVLVMTVSDYPQKPLPGVRFDADNALRLAARFGYDTRQAVLLRDRQLSAGGIREALRGLADRVRMNDRVFVYFSGHGASFARDGLCVQALVGQDLALVDTAELVAGFDQVKAKVSDGMLILDACHSGGNRDVAMARGLPAEGARGHAPDPVLQSKVWTPKSGEQCAQPVNRLAKSWTAPAGGLARGMVNPEHNFTLIAAASEREEALDDRDAGGLATLGLLECAGQGVSDVDGSQTASVDEVVACAQQYVARRVPDLNRLNGTRYTPHTLEAHGNRHKSLPVRVLPGAVSPQDRASLVLAGFRSLEAGSNGNFAFDLKASASEVTIGGAFDLTLTAGQPGYVYLLYVGSDRRDIKQLWPPVGQLRRLEPGSKTLSLAMEKPAGENTFLAILSQTPLDVAAILGDGSAQVTPQTLQSLDCAGQRMRNVSLKDEGGGCGWRNASLKGESVGVGLAGYAARVIRVDGK